MDSRLLMINAENSLEILNALASETRLSIIKLINANEMSVNSIASSLKLPQSTISTNITILEKAGLIKVKSSAGKRGTQKICYSPYNEIVIEMPGVEKSSNDNIIEVSMPLGLYTDFEVAPDSLIRDTINYSVKYVADLIG